MAVDTEGLAITVAHDGPRPTRSESAVCTSTSAYAAVTESSATPADLLFQDHGGDGLMAVRWRRKTARLKAPRRLTDHLLSYCAAGEAMSTIVLDGKPIRIHQRPRSVVFVPAGRSVQWTLEAAREVVHVHIYIPVRAQAAAATPRGAGWPAVASEMISVRDPWLDGYFKLLIAEYAVGASVGRGLDSPFLDETGSLLVRHLNMLLHTTLAEHASPGQGRVSALRPFILSRIESFVQAHLDTEISLQCLADIASLSVGHLVRSFHLATGLTPHQYVLERRLDRACDLLCRGTAHVSDIARRCGFSSVSHFSAMFRVHRGLSPSEFRRRH